MTPGPPRLFAVIETPAFSVLVSGYERKEHSKLRADIAWLTDKLRVSPEVMGDRPPGLQELALPIYKARCKDSCHRVGQRAGWRIFYAVNKDALKVLLLFLYHKGECENPGTEFLIQKLEKAFGLGTQP
ncbi:MAG TPA: hypothetical protein VN829_20540 [Dongiaceae bacterium]|nr:hypothetical protein [Dongiaceae bacterium]